MFTRLSLLFLLSVTSLCNANAESYDQKHLQSLFDSYKRGASYSYAEQYRSEMEGDPYFDYFYGVSAIDTGHASEGVFALERVLLTFPNDQVARLELARGYFVLQEYTLARESFEQVLALEPPPTVKNTAEAYLDKIRVSESRYRPTHSGFIQLSLGTDDNANVGIDDDTIFLGGSFDPSALKQDDNFTELSGAWTYVHPFSPGWLFESTLSGNLHKNQDLDQFDTATGTVQLAITHLQATNKYKVGLISQAFLLDGDGYRSLNGLNFNWIHTLNQSSSLNSFLQVAQLDYDDVPIKNADLITLGINYTKSFSVYLQPLFFTSIGVGKEMAEDDSILAALSETERDFYSIRAGVSVSFTNTLALQTSIGTQHSSYEGVPALQTAIREDDYNTADIGLLWAFSRKWRLNTRYSYTENKSNANFRDYQRNVEWLHYLVPR